MQHNLVMNDDMSFDLNEIGADLSDTTSRSPHHLGPVSIVKRAIQPHIQACIESLDPSKFHNLRLAGSRKTIGKAISRALDAQPGIPVVLSDWLKADIDNLMRLYSHFTSSTNYLLRLEAIRDDACRRFHADNVSYRLVTTYHGPGTEWISPKNSSLVENGQPHCPDIVRKLETGWIAIMRGRKNANNQAPALLHRSPAIEDRGLHRLFLSIDELTDHALLVADNV